MHCHCRSKMNRRSPTAAKPVGIVFGGILLLACLSLLSGCASSFQATCAPYVEHKRRAIIILNARSEAKQTWAENHASQYIGDPNAADARHGFITGYVDTALGYVNSPPPVPTRPCIGIHTLAHTYPDAGAWYSSYQQGAAAALSTGVDQWRLAPMDPALLQPQCGCQTRSHFSGISMDQPRDAMADEDQYISPGQSAEPSNDLPPPQEPRPSLQQKGIRIIKPSEADSLKKLAGISQ